MPKVTVMPLGATIEAQDGESVFDAAVDAGYTWPTVCGGAGSCRTCYMQVLEGADNFEVADDWELEGLEDIAVGAGSFHPSVRLACQALVHGEATVRKRGVKPPPTT